MGDVVDKEALLALAKKAVVDAAKDEVKSSNGGKEALAGAAAGAAIGTVVPLIGNVIGGLVGGVTGYVFAKWDDWFPRSMDMVVYDFAGQTNISKRVTVSKMWFDTHLRASNENYLGMKYEAAEILIMDLINKSGFDGGYLDNLYYHANGQWGGTKWFITTYALDPNGVLQTVKEWAANPLFNMDLVAAGLVSSAKVPAAVKGPRSYGHKALDDYDFSKPIGFDKKKLESGSVSLPYFPPPKVATMSFSWFFFLPLLLIAPFIYKKIIKK